MIVHCKACDKTFDTDQYDCEEDLLCPFEQIIIIEDENDKTDENNQPGEGNPAPSDSPKRNVQ